MPLIPKIPIIKQIQLLCRKTTITYSSHYSDMFHPIFDVHTHPPRPPITHQPLNSYSSILYTHIFHMETVHQNSTNNHENNKRNKKSVKTFVQDTVGKNINSQSPCYLQIPEKTKGNQKIQSFINNDRRNNLGWSWNISLCIKLRKLEMLMVSWLLDISAEQVWYHTFEYTNQHLQLTSPLPPLKEFVLRLP